MMIGGPRMYLIYHFLKFNVPRIILLVILLGQASEGLEFCFNATLEGFRLSATILRAKCVPHFMVCVMECVNERCCRSINYKKTLVLQNEPNCEMLHEVVYNMSEKVLEPNSSYDHYYVTDPQKGYNSSCFDVVGTAKRFMFIDNCPNPKPLGMENGEIPDDAITASSTHGHHYYQPHYARLRKTGSSCCWTPLKAEKVNSWLQVDLGKQAIVTGIATQGSCTGAQQWPISYSVSHSTDGHNWTFYQETEDVKTFQANRDVNSIVTHNFKNPIHARYIRLWPKSWRSYPTMRLEYYGCRQ